jgi:DNA-binding response OmpR family regulator
MRMFFTLLSSFLFYILFIPSCIAQIELNPNEAIEFLESPGTPDGTEIVRPGGNALRIRYFGSAIRFEALDDKLFQLRNSLNEINVQLHSNGEKSHLLGKLGIGTDSPTSKLHVVDNSPVFHIRAEINNCDLTIKPSNGNIETTNTALHLNRFSISPVVIAQGGGNVGLGITGTPTQKLEELVKLLDGEITVEIQFGQGTKFAILLPIRHLVKEVAKENLQIPSLISETIQFEKEATQYPSNLPQRQRPLVLLIEDNKDVITYLTSFLNGEYEIITALNGKNGIEKAIELIPGLIVSDVMMPEKYGFEFCQVLKEDERTSHIPIILLTAKSDHNAKMEGLTKGADAYLAKPFNKEELLVRMDLVQLRKRLQNHYESFVKLLTIKSVNIPIKEDIFLQKIIEIVEENLSDEHFGLPDLYRKAAISRTPLIRKLKVLTGKSTTHFIRSIRLEKARELLETTNINVSKIAFEVGFSSPAYFTKMFKGEFGQSLSEISKK